MRVRQMEYAKILMLKVSNAKKLHIYNIPYAYVDHVINLIAITFFFFNFKGINIFINSDRQIEANSVHPNFVKQKYCAFFLL